jgi:hypothetical protein
VHPEPMMKRLLPVLLAILAIGLLTAGAAEKAPAILFDGIAKDVGTVTEGASLKHVFTFKNKGDATLEILKVEPS